MPNRYVLLLLVTSLLWGGNFVVGKSLVGHASPMTLTSIRWMIAVLCLFPIVCWNEKTIFPSRAALLPLFFMGVTGVVLFNLFQFMALERTTATNAGLISALNTISISVFSFLFLKERINRLQIFSMTLSLVGVILVLSKGNADLLLSFHLNTGDLWMMGSVGVWGIYSVCSRWAMTKTSPMKSTLYSGIFGLIVLLPFNFSDFTVSDITLSFIQSILYTGVISTVVCIVLWNIGVQKLGTTTAGMFLNFNPVFTTILAFLFLGEQLTWVQGIGGCMVILGCYLFSIFKGKTVPERHQRHGLAQWRSKI